MPVALLELVIFAALAAVVLFQLYAVLGRRVGRQPEDAEADAERPRVPDARRPEDEPAGALAAPVGVAAIRQRDPAFEPHRFITGARTAYEMVVKAFAAGDRETLKDLASVSVYQTFDKAIGQREADGRTEQVEFLQPPRADLESAEMDKDVARVKVRFLAEVRNRSKGPEGEAVDDRRTAEVWTFERRVDSRDPNWALARVEAAQACCVAHRRRRRSSPSTPWPCRPAPPRRRRVLRRPRRISRRPRLPPSSRRLRRRRRCRRPSP